MQFILAMKHRHMLAARYRLWCVAKRKATQDVYSIKQQIATCCKQTPHSDTDRHSHSALRLQPVSYYYLFGNNLQ
jgi:hypothetical protein